MPISALSYTNNVSLPNVKDYKNDYFYNGKELITEFGLNWEDYGWRNYDAVLGRWWSVDPHAENYYSWSPYAYCANNPILLIDPDGMDWKDPEKDGKIAADMQKGLEKRETSLNKALTKLESKAEDIKNNEKYSAEKKEKKLADNQKDIESTKSSISDVQSAQTELKEMGETKSMTFTFNYLGSDASAGYLSSESDGAIVINHTGDLGNKAHESKHAYQDLTGMIKVIPGTNKISVSSSNRDKMETQDYQRQFSVSGSSRLPNSDAGSVKYFNAITKSWVQGINANGIYPYK